MGGWSITSLEKVIFSIVHRMPEDIHVASQPIHPASSAADLSSKITTFRIDINRMYFHMASYTCF